MPAELVRAVRGQVTPAVTRRAVRLRRARGVVAYWQDNRFVLENFFERTRAAAPEAAVRVLDVCSSPRTLAAIRRALHGYRAADVSRLVRDLLRVRLLERVGHARDAKRPATAAWDDWNPAAGFFHFSTRDVAFPNSPAEAARLWRRLGPTRPMPSPIKRSPQARRIALPAAAAPEPFVQVLTARRTWREFARAPVEFQHVATLLRLTWGIQRWATVPGQGQVALKTSPSGGARHPGEVYVVARRVEGLAPGLYHYETADDTLAALPRRRLPAIADLLPGQPWYRDAPVLLVMTAVFERAQWRYAFPRAYRAVLIEAGHLCQTCCLIATSLGLAPFCSMAFPDSRVDAMLGLDGVGESALYIAGVGVPPAAGWRPWQPGVRPRSRSQEVMWPHE